MKSLLRRKKIITCKQNEVIENGVITVENGRIAFVGRQAELADSSPYDEIDLSHLIKIYVTGEAWKDTSTVCYMTEDEIRVCAAEAHLVGLKIAAHCHGGIGLRLCLEAGVDTIEHGAMIAEANIERFLKAGSTLIATFNPYMHASTLVPGRPPEFVTGVKRVQENMHGPWFSFNRPINLICFGH